MVSGFRALWQPIQWQVELNLTVITRDHDRPAAFNAVKVSAETRLGVVVVSQSLPLSPPFFLDARPSRRPFSAAPAATHPVRFGLATGTLDRAAARSKPEMF